VKQKAVMDFQVRFEAKGIVLGNYWGGGKGSYTAKRIKANTLEELLTIATKMLDDGSLDSGMGYESLIGASLEVSTITTVLINDKEFINTETEIHFIGDLSEEESEFLENVWYS
jgi:deoxyxylulose-5-phosphate synthase